MFSSFNKNMATREHISEYLMEGPRAFSYSHFVDGYDASR